MSAYTISNLTSAVGGVVMLLGMIGLTAAAAGSVSVHVGADVI